MILDGKLVANRLKAELRQKLFEHADDKPSLSIYQVGDNPASSVYIRNKQKACDEVGIRSDVIKLPADSFTRDIALATYLEKNPSDGVMLQLPLPEGWNADYFTSRIPAEKDADCLSHQKLGEFFADNDPTFGPCTAQGIIDLLDYYEIPIRGKHAVVIGRSNIVGKPIAHWLTTRHATVTVCHSKTENLSSYTREADILIVAIGKPKFITSDMIKPGATIVDVGINRLEDNTLCGDVDFENVKDIAGAITPVPGGVGPMTVYELLANTVKLHAKAKGYNYEY